MNTQKEKLVGFVAELAPKMLDRIFGELQQLQKEVVGLNPEADLPKLDWYREHDSTSPSLTADQSIRGIIVTVDNSSRKKTGNRDSQTFGVTFQPTLGEASQMAIYEHELRGQRNQPVAGRWAFRALTEINTPDILLHVLEHSNVKLNTLKYPEGMRVWYENFAQHAGLMKAN